MSDHLTVPQFLTVNKLSPFALMILAQMAFGLFYKRVVHRYDPVAESLMDSPTWKRTDRPDARM